MTLHSPIAGVISCDCGHGDCRPGRQAAPAIEVQVVPEGGPSGRSSKLRAQRKRWVFERSAKRLRSRIDSTFPYATYGTIPGKIVNVAKDALPAGYQQEPRCKPPPSTAMSRKRLRYVRKPANINVFPLTVEASRSTMNIDGRTVALTSGMAVTIDVKTEDRRVIDYIASPIIELFTTAAHEQ